MPAKPKNADKNPARNDLYTPTYTLEPLLSYLPKDQLIWESAAGKHHLVDALEINGYRVIASTLDDGQDYFHYQPELWDTQITNPPYSLKYEWLARAYQLQKPFALLLPADTLFAAKAQKLFQQYGYQMLLPSQRVDYWTPKWGWNSNAQFTSAWFCWQLPGLAQGVTFCTLNKPKKSRNHITTDDEMVRSSVDKKASQLELFA